MCNSFNVVKFTSFLNFQQWKSKYQALETCFYWQSPFFISSEIYSFRICFKNTVRICIQGVSEMDIYQAIIYSWRGDNLTRLVLMFWQGHSCFIFLFRQSTNGFYFLKQLFKIRYITIRKTMTSWLNKKIEFLENGILRFITKDKGSVLETPRLMKL